MITGGFGFSFDLTSGTARHWAMGRDGAKRWTEDSNVEEPMKIDMGEQDFIAVSALRYAIGRKTYVVEETCRWLTAHWQELDTRAQDVIVCDLDEALGAGARIGMDCDHREWEALRRFISSCDAKDECAYMNARQGHNT